MLARLMAASTATVPSWTAERALSDPPREPIGVRAAPTMKISWGVKDWERGMRERRGRKRYER